MAEIVCVAMPSWEGNFLKSTVELMKELADHNKVWYLDYQYTLKDVLFGFFGKKTIPWKRIIGIQNRVREIQIQQNKKIFIYTPYPIIPSFWVPSFALFSFINKINHSIVFAPFKRLLKSRGVNPDFIISALNPFMGLGVKKKFPGSKHIYYCYDEIKAAHWLKKFGGNAEDLLLQNVDAVVFTSEYLLQIKDQGLTKTAIVKNGVHFEVFSKNVRKTGQNKIPIIGYLGSIDDRFDINLIEQVIKALPDFEFHFVGRIVFREVSKRLEKFCNVKFFPAVRAEEVPPILAKMDIGIIPYLKNEFTIAVYPLKVNEYLAVGLPVIMTSFANLPEFKGLVDLADDVDSFVNAIHRNLSGDTEELIHKRLRFAESNSWKRRAGDLEKFLISLQATDFEFHGNQTG
jgi:teichuronic acid biosynthesis glycosyltransferase TuaH